MFSGESKRKLQEADHRWRVRSILKIIVAVLSLIGFSLYAAAIPIWEKYFIWVDGPSAGDWQDALPLGVMVVAFFWSSVTLFLLLHLKLHMNPIIPLVIDLLIWVALIPAVRYSAGYGIFLHWDAAEHDELTDFGWHIFKKVGGLEMGGLVFACLVWVLEVALFTLGCLDTYRWYKARNGAPQSERALDHGEYAQDSQFHVAPPKYEESHSRGIEMHPTSPTAREFV